MNQSSPGLHYGLGKVHRLTGNFTACLAKEDTALAMTGVRSAEKLSLLVQIE